MSQTKIATARSEGPTATSDLVQQLREGLGGAQPALALAFASPKVPLAEAQKALKEAFPEATVLGASTAGEFTQAGEGKGGVAGVAVAGDFVVRGGLATGLKAGAAEAVEKACAGLMDAIDGYPYRTAIMLVDPLAGNGEEAALVAATLLGEGVQLAGGAAGDDLAMAETHVALDEQAASDAVVMAVLHSKAPVGVGVAHGHLPISEPVKITKAEGNVVHEIDGRPAWEVWAERTRDAAKEAGLDPDELSPDDVVGYLLRYEAGLRTGDSYKIRAPLSKDDAGALSFACGIPEGSQVQITESGSDRQVESAIQAAKNARAQLGDHAPAGAIVFDCICRNLILGDGFVTAVKGMSQELGGVPLAGFETYGEIALNATDLSGFHNTTTVVLALP